MNFFTLKYFIDTFENRSFSRAAQINYVSQTAISQQIAKLEDDFDVTFFDRTKKPIVPTIEAEVFYKDAKKLFQQYEIMLDNLEMVKKRPIRFGYTMHAQANFLIQAFAAIPSKLIDFPITFVPSQAKNSIDALINNEVDIVTAPSVDTKLLSLSFHHRLIYSGQYLLAINKKNPLAKKKKIVATDLKDTTILTLQSGEKDFRKIFFEKIPREEELNIHFKSTSDNYSSLLLSVLLDEGVCFVPDYLSKEIYEKNIAFRKIEDNDLVIELSICWLDEHDKNIKKMIRLLTANLPSE